MPTTQLRQTEPRTLTTIALTECELSIDASYCDTLICDPSLSNPFVRTEEAIGWCRCTPYFKPGKFLFDKLASELVIRCMDCGQCVAVTQDQKIALMLSLAIHQDSKVRAFQRWQRRLVDLITGNRRRGVMDRLASFLENSAGHGRRSYPNPRRRLSNSVVLPPQRPGGDGTWVDVVATDRARANDARVQRPDDSEAEW